MSPVVFPDSLVATPLAAEWSGCGRATCHAGILKLLVWCGRAGIGRAGSWGNVEGLAVSDRGHRARGVAVSPFCAEPARRCGADACPRRGGHLRDDPVWGWDVRAV